MSWKEKLNDRYGAFEFAPEITNFGRKNLIAFISTEIIENLIAEIPKGTSRQTHLGYEDSDFIKQQLRDKWL